MSEKFKKIVEFVHQLYNSSDFIPLHEPRFVGNEKKYLNECIDSTFVSSVGKFVDRFEETIRDYTGAKFAVATVNGTAALQIALKLAGVQNGNEVITQPLTFIATCNAISYCGAEPVFIDVEKDTLTMSSCKLEEFLETGTIVKDDGNCYSKQTNRVISACVPVHTFGHPAKIEQIKALCEKHNIIIVEDAAESLGSTYKGKHTGTFGLLGIYSFNGNKTITCGGGGAIVTDDEPLGRRAKHITTTAKVPHQFEYVHDEIGYNYRMPNINAALACAQMENLEDFITRKRELANEYRTFFNAMGIGFIVEPEDCRSNYWLNSIVLGGRDERDNFLKYSNMNGVMTRPIWRLMNKLDMYKDCQHTTLENAQWLEDRAVNIPSSVRV